MNDGIGEQLKAVLIMAGLIFSLSLMFNLLGIHGSRSMTPYGDAECYYSDCY
jgi:hypothetical protein